MESKLLLPNRYKLVGWCLLLPAVAAGLIISFSDFETGLLNTKVFSLFNGGIMNSSPSFSFIETDITNTLVGVFFIVGALLVCFSKEKREDEFISKIRLNSLLWAVLVNYVLLLLAFIFVYGSAFLTVMIYNMFTIFIIFIVRFNYILYRNTKLESDEK